jgi:spore coat protein CotH
MGHTYAGEMKIRGAASASYPKNSYTLRFPDEDLDASAVGLGNKDHLVLITTFDDNSYVRQKLAYDVWMAMADHAGADRMTPRTFFAVVYRDGEYWGLYTACDRIDDHFAQEMGLSRDGNLYKSVNHDANFYRTNSGGGTKATLHDGYEKKEGDPPQGAVGAFDDLDALVAFSADHDDATFWAEAPGWFRVDEFADWFLLVHYIAADDSGGKNAYLYNDPDNPEFRYCPWDMNHSFGQGWYVYRVDPDTNNDFTWTNGIFAHLQHQPQASAELWQRFDDLRDSGPLQPPWFVDTLDDYYALIDVSARRDWAVWSGQYQSYWGGYNTNDYPAEQAYLRDWLDERDHWMSVYHP